jgi:hypothetical protein
LKPFKSLILFFLLLSAALFAKKIDIVANFPLAEHFPLDQERLSRETGHEVRVFDLPFHRYRNEHYSDAVDFIFFMNDSEEEHNQYIERIRTYLKTDQASLYSPENYIHPLSQAILRLNKEKRL